MNWKEDIDKNGCNILVAEREGYDFKIEFRGYGKLYIATVDNKYGMACKDLEFTKKWCEDFEVCYNCGDGVVHADKLCWKCYFDGE